MSDFYTSVCLLGDDILIRGYEHGSPVQYREKSRPTLFLVPQAQQKTSKYRTLDGRYAHPKRFDGASEAREFIKQYEGASGLEVHGYERFVYQHIAQKWKGEIDYDMSQMTIWTIDIEVGCENGFPDVQASAEEMLCITMKNFNHQRDNHLGDSESLSLLRVLNTVSSGQSKRCYLTSTSGGPRTLLTSSLDGMQSV